MQVTLPTATEGRLGSSSPHPHHQQLASTRRPFNKWTLDMIGIWLDSLGLGAYVNELAHAGVQSGETLAGLSSSDLEVCESSNPQVWSLTQFYSVDFSKSRIGVNKCVFNRRKIKVCISCF